MGDGGDLSSRWIAVYRLTALRIILEMSKCTRVPMSFSTIISYVCTNIR